MTTFKKYELYKKIMRSESELYRPQRGAYWAPGYDYAPAAMANLSWRLLDIAKGAFVPRGYNKSYGLSSEEFYFESVSAHTNLVTAIVTAALDFYCGISFGSVWDAYEMSYGGYSYRDIIEVVRLHDLAENETGDIADNGMRDEIMKNDEEFLYVEAHLATYPLFQNRFRRAVLGLFKEMQEKSSPTGTLIYLADKVAALVITLALDREGRSPLISPDSPDLSERDRQEIEICDCSYDGKYRASEMWATDFFMVRKLAELDTDLFFTALVVMMTLDVHDRWYSWREKEYSKKM